MCGFTKLYNSNQDYSSQMRKRFHPPSTALYNLQYSDTFWERIFTFWVFCFHPCLFWQGQGMSPGLLGLGLDHNRLLFSGVGLFPGPSWSILAHPGPSWFILPKVFVLVHPSQSYQKFCLTRGPDHNELSPFSSSFQTWSLSILVHRHIIQKVRKFAAK